MGWTPACVGALVLLHLYAVRAFASATPERVYIFERELSWGCLSEKAFGLPCPACGMTRSVLLTLHNRVGAALALNPAGPLLVAGLLLAAASLIFLAFYQHARNPRAVGALQRRLRRGARAYSSLLLIVLFAHWLAELCGR